MIKELAFLGAGFSVLQVLVGVAITLSKVTFLLTLHVFVGVALLAISLACSSLGKGMVRRMCVGNVFLVLSAGVIGLVHTSGPLLLLHTFLALGVLSNFSVIYGFQRGLEKGKS